MTGARNFLFWMIFHAWNTQHFLFVFDDFFAYHRFPSNYALPSPVAPRGCIPFLTFELIRINAIINLTFLRNNIIFHLILLVPLQFIKIRNLKYATFYARKLHVPTCNPSYFHMDQKMSSTTLQFLTHWHIGPTCYPLALLHRSTTSSP
jgi:hypothetical protein